jgi:toxin-antitoxin system PIN domain toxin
MLMPDVNVLVYAHRQSEPEHLRYAEWLVSLADGPEPFALSETVLHGFLRLTTHPHAFPEQPTNAAAFAFIDQLLALPTCHMMRPGPLHWSILRELCERPGIRGKLVADAVHAATAIENGCEWVTADTDFARFSPPLRWRNL